MAEQTLLSIVESPSHPNFTQLYQKLGLVESKVASQRKAMAQIKKSPPDLVVAEFFYGYANNYAGINISNLDVFLYALQRYAPKAKMIVLVAKEERQYVDKLNEILPLAAVMVMPVTEEQMGEFLQQL